MHTHLVATAISASAQTWVTETQCISNCDIPTGTPNKSYSPEGGPSIAWGGMSKRATENIKECGTNPLCMLFRAAVGYPIALLFDGPYYAVKGVGYGLYYTGIGIGKAGKSIGRGIAYPFRERPQPPPGSWEAYKRQILRMQKKLAKRDKASRENAKWCKGHVPLSHGPSRGEWESRCNPGDIVSRDSLPPDVRHANSGEVAPMGLPKEAAESALRAADAARETQLMKAGLSPVGPALSAVAAAPAASPLPEASLAPAPGNAGSPDAVPVSPPADSASPSPATVSGESAVSPSAESAGVPLSGTGVTASLPPSANPVLRDAKEVLQQDDEVVKDAAHGGFDSKEAMLGTKQQGVMAAFDASAQVGPRGDIDYQADIAAIGHERMAGGVPPLPYHGAASGAGAAILSQAAGANPQGSGIQGRTPIVSPPTQGTRTIGDPNRYKSTFAIQSGETCVAASARQLLSEFGITMTESELYSFAFSHSFHRSGAVCNKPNKGDWCDFVFEPATGTCRILFNSGGRQVPGTISDVKTCELARQYGGILVPQIGAFLTAVSGRKFRSLYTPFPAPGVYVSKSARKKELPRARAELLDALRQGKGVLVTVEGRTLWSNPLVKRKLHSILVTAAVEKTDGTLLGFYVNDTSRLGAHARYLPVDRFERAWLDDNLHRAFTE